MSCPLHPHNTKYVREHSFSVGVVIDAQYTKTSAGRILPQIPVLETNIFPRYFRQTYASERTPASIGGSFLLQREQRY